MRAGATRGVAQQLSVATTGVAGGFSLDLPAAVAADDVLYITASHGRVDGRPLPPTVELATALDDIRSGPVVVNELTTVAAGYSLAQFAANGAVGGVNPGLRNAATMLRNFVDMSTGREPRFLRQAPNGSETETLSSFNSLASIIAGCVAGANDCAAFLTAATDAWGGDRPPRGRR
jgi:hypothetical protein